MNFRETFRKALRSSPSAEAGIDDVYIDPICSSTDMEIDLDGYIVFVDFGFMHRPSEDDVTILDDDLEELDGMDEEKRIIAEEVNSYFDDVEEDYERCRRAAASEERLHDDLNYWCR